MSRQNCLNVPPIERAAMIWRTTYLKPKARIAPDPRWAKTDNLAYQALRAMFAATMIRRYAFRNDSGEWVMRNGVYRYVGSWHDDSPVIRVELVATGEVTMERTVRDGEVTGNACAFEEDE